MREVGHYASSGGGIMLQVVDTNAGGGALCCRGGALCFKWWIRTREMGHYASEAEFVHWRMKVEQFQDSRAVAMVQYFIGEKF